MRKVFVKTLLVLGCVCVVNCSQDETLELSNQAPSVVSNSYLELVPSQGDVMVELRNIETLREAEKRIKPYVQYENGILSLNLKSGKEINISEEIYEIYIRGIDLNNSLLKSGDLIYSDGHLYSTKVQYNKFPRLRNNKIENNNKSYDVEYETYLNGGWTETITCNNQTAALDYYKDHQDTQSEISTILGVAAMGTGDSGLDLLYNTITIIRTSQESLFSDLVYDAARNGGLTIRTVCTPCAGFNGINFMMTSYIYDKDGNILGMISR